MKSSSQRRKPTLPGILLWVLPAFFFAFFFFYPLGRILTYSLQGAVTEGFPDNALALAWKRLSFTIFQAGVSTLLTLLVGLPAAYVVSRFRFPGKSFLMIFTTLPFILPTMVVIASLNALFGPQGWVNLLLMQLLGLTTPPLQFINTFWAILLAHVFYNTSIVIRVTSAAWSQLPTNLEDAARSLGASPFKAFREITLPLLRPALLAAALLVFLFDFSSFGVILLLGGPRFGTLETEIYTQALHMLNFPMAGLLSSIQLVCVLLVTSSHLSLSSNLSIPIMPHTQEESTQPPRNWKEILIVVSILVLLLGLFVIPLAGLAARSFSQIQAGSSASAGQTSLTLDYYAELFINRRESLFYVPPSAAVKNSLLYAIETMTISLLLGFLVIYAARRKVFWLDRLMQSLMMLPLGTSAVTLGLGFILAFSGPPLALSTKPILIPIAHSLVALPMVISILQPALASIPQTFREAAAVLGATPFRIWLKIDLPILGRAALVCAIFSFTISMGEFGATTFLARPEYPTIPIAIYRFLSQPGALNYGQALAMSTLLMIICGAGMLGIEAFSRRPS